MSTELDYVRDGTEIYRRSFATIRAEANLDRLPPDVAQVAVRMIHACGMVDLVDDLRWSQNVVGAARAALRNGAPILCDATMVASGITRKRLPADNEILCLLSDPQVPELAAAMGNTRSAAAVDLWGDRLGGAVVAFGNAPTALFRLLELLADGAPRPAAVLGLPVGFIGAAESKDALAASRPGVPAGSWSPRGIGHGRRRHQCHRPRAGAAGMTGTLYGVGLGPGDPELVTVKAARLLASAEVIAFHSARHGNSVARGIAEEYLNGNQVEEPLRYPVTVETTDHPGGYRGALEEFYDDAAARLAVHLDDGRDVVVLCEGDPLFYGSYMHLHKRLADRYPAVVVPGVTSVAGAAAELGRPLVEGEEVLTILPGTLPPTVLAERLAAADSVAIMKLGRTFTGVRDALAASGRLDEAWYIERATTDRQRIAPLSEVEPASVPYFSLALLPSKLSPGLRAAAAPDAVEQIATGRGEVVVVGLGPAGRDWLTPQAQAALSAAEDLVGYGPYLDRVPPNPRQRRHASDNQVEDVRAEFALDLARRGRRVAVVSSGDPGIFAMAAAVLEAAEGQEYKDVPIRVLPGLTAAAAVASRVGAPLGGDFCVLSLSDRLKPWELIEKRLSGVAAADLVIAIYNPASKSRTWQLARAQELLLEHRGPDTPVVIGRDVGGPAERIVVRTLADLDPTEVDMRCLLIVGSSTTRLLTRGDGSVAVLTPRRCTPA